MTRKSIIRKSDLVPAFAAAKATGYEHCTVTVEEADGRRVRVTAGPASDSDKADLSPLEKWKAGRAAS